MEAESKVNSIEGLDNNINGQVTTDREVYAWIPYVRLVCQSSWRPGYPLAPWAWVWTVDNITVTSF